MKKVFKNKAVKAIAAWILAVSMVVPMFSLGTVVKAADVSAGDEAYGDLSGDDQEINKEMPEIVPKQATLLASVDFSTTKEGANGTFSGSSDYNIAKNDEVDLTNGNVCDDPLTLEEIKSIEKEYSIVFRAKLGIPEWSNENEQPVLTIASKKDTSGIARGTALYVDVPAKDNQILHGACKNGNWTSTPAGHFTGISGSNIAKDDTWHTVAIVQSEDTLTYYVDGAVRLSTASKHNQTIGSLFDEITELSDVVACIGTFGGLSYNRQWNLSAKMDYYQLYKGALSAEEVAAFLGETGDNVEINKMMPKLSSAENAELLASVDFSTTKEGANGTFSGSSDYNIAKNDEVDLTNGEVCNDPLTLEEIKSIEKEYSIVFRAKLGIPEWSNENEQPVLTIVLENPPSTACETGLYVGVPARSNWVFNGSCEKNTWLSGNHQRDVTGTNIAGDEEWHTIALVQSADTITYYVDGEVRLVSSSVHQKDIGSLFGDLNSSDIKACIGTFGGSYNKSWNLSAKMDYYQLYKGALTASEVAELTETAECQYVVKSYDISLYRGESNKAPKLDGYVFAGWYETEDCETSIGQDVKEGTCYGKFVPKYVLSIRAQVSSNLLDTNLNNDDTGAIRFVTTVDSRKYNEVGFIFDIQGGEQNYKVSNSLVYTKLFAVDPATGEKGEPETLTPQGTFCPLSEYFKTCTFYNIPEIQYSVKITATPFWETLDGTMVYGVKATKTIRDGIPDNWAYVSTTGSDENPGTKAQPYASLNKALEAAEDGGVVYVSGSYKVESPGTSWISHGKDVTITGDTLDFSAEKTVNINDAVTFQGITLNFADETSVYANGNRLKIDSDATVNGVLLVYGAGNGGTVESTDVTLLSGDYMRAFGAGVNATVTGDVNLYIAGDVNKTREFKSGNDFVVYGAGNQGTVEGNVNLYVGGNTNSSLDLMKTASNGNPVSYATLYGGGARSTVNGNIYVTVEGNAQFSAIYGNGYQGTCKGDTHVTVRGNVNSSIKNCGTTDHNTYATLNGGGAVGGSTSDIVEGDTYVTIDGPVYFMHVWGGGNGKAAAGDRVSRVGNTHVIITENAADAKIMSIYGGSYYAENKNTSLVIKAGNLQQVFGGSQAASMTGNVDLQVLGGIITRRIYGGCYNDCDPGILSDKWQSEHYVTGNISVTIGTDVNITWDSQTDHALVGRSRRDGKAADEKSVIIVKDYERNQNLSKVGYSSYFSGSDAYDFLVKITAGGNVYLEDGMLRIVPDAGYTATVSYGGSIQGFEAEGTYTLPENAGDKAEITVTFTAN